MRKTDTGARKIKKQNQDATRRFRARWMQIPASLGGEALPR